MSLVTLKGGVYDGVETDVKSTTKMFTWVSVVEMVGWDVDDRVQLVPRIELHSYQRVSDDTFEACDTPR